MHLYAFGSIVRGDVTLGSDVDLLAIVEGRDVRFDPNVFSIYSYRRIRELWQEGNPFAWHLSLEAKLFYSSTGFDLLKELGRPAAYKACKRDCEKFFALFHAASHAIRMGTNSVVFNLSIVFLSIRNFATCYSLGLTSKPNFSRTSALSLGRESIQLTKTNYSVLERARILSTRGFGAPLTQTEAKSALEEFHKIESWMRELLGKVTSYG
jgi:hypothetical protein